MTSSRATVAESWSASEPVYALDGTPRWELEPDVVVNPLRAADGHDPFIAAAIEELTRHRPATR